MTSDGTTHWPTCWKQEVPKHHRCALARIERLDTWLRELLLTYDPVARPQLDVDAIVERIRTSLEGP